MAIKDMDYEMIVGLEVHAELKTKTKLFCSCPTTFGLPANTACCPICMGHPGTLPVLNRTAVTLAVRAGLATNCIIARRSGHDRKNYFYPDMPKAYQISQYDTPICRGGHITIEINGTERRIGITRIHIEEDAGKLIHDGASGARLDFNRCGIPLIEIVSEPDIRSAEEARAYLKKLRAILLSADISDCRMNEGSLRCDVNLSVRKRGESKFGIRTEIKNLNSISFVGKAIEYEFERQVSALLAGQAIHQETRRFDSHSGKTILMRVKEETEDYRYFPEPDLPDICVTDDLLEEARRTLPMLPDERKKHYKQAYGLPDDEAEQLAYDPAMAQYFEAAVSMTDFPKTLANLIRSEVLRLCNSDSFLCPIFPAHMGELASLMGSGRINSSTAKRLIDELWTNDQSPEQLVRERKWEQINDRVVLLNLLKKIIAANPKAVADYRNGKKAAIRVIVGQAMARTEGCANPILLNQLAEQALISQDE